MEFPNNVSVLGAETANNLKIRQRNERDQYSEALSLRIHRAISWLTRAEQCSDTDGRFVFLWISFNAAYSNELGGISIAESEQFRHFLSKLVELDTQQKLYDITWKKYTSAIRVLLDNQYVYQPFWNHHNCIAGFSEWEKHFKASKQAANIALANKDTSAVLGIIFNRLYTLRNQIIHGGATWNSSANRNQLRDATAILGDLVPALIEIMMDNKDVHWGEACYPVIG